MRAWPLPLRKRAFQLLLLGCLLAVSWVLPNRAEAQTSSQIWELTIQFPGTSGFLHRLTVDSAGAFTGTRTNELYTTDCTTGTYSIRGRFSGSRITWEGQKAFSCLVEGTWKNYPIYDYGDGSADASFPNATRASGAGTARTVFLRDHLGAGKGYQSATYPYTVGFSWSARLVSGAPTTPAPTLPPPIAPFDYSVSLTPASASAPGNGTTAFRVSVSPLSGTPQQVFLQPILCERFQGQEICSGPGRFGPNDASGVTLTVLPASGVPPFAATFVFNAERRTTPLKGTLYLRVMADRDSAVTRSFTATRKESNEAVLTFMETPLVFALNVSPSSRTVVAGNYTDYDITIAPQGGTLPEGRSLTVKVSGLPAGAFSSFYSQRGAAAGAITNLYEIDNSRLQPVLAITTAKTMPEGQYTFAITAESDNAIYATTEVTLIVKKPLKITLSTPPGAGRVVWQGQTTIYPLKLSVSDRPEGDVRLLVQFLRKGGPLGESPKAIPKIDFCGPMEALRPGIFRCFVDTKNSLGPWEGKVEISQAPALEPGEWTVAILAEAREQGTGRTTTDAAEALLFVVEAPRITITVDKDHQAVDPGDTAAFTGRVDNVGQGAGKVDFLVRGPDFERLKDQAVLTLRQRPLTGAPGGPPSAFEWTLQVSPHELAKPGIYQLALEVSVGPPPLPPGLALPDPPFQKEVRTLRVEVRPFTVAIDVDGGDTQTVDVAGVARYRVTISRLTGWAHAVRLGFVPTGIASLYGPNIIRMLEELRWDFDGEAFGKGLPKPQFSSILTVRTRPSAIPAGEYSLEVHVVDTVPGRETVTVGKRTLKVRVPPFKFRLSVFEDRDSQTVRPGSKAEYGLVITRLEGPPQPVKLIVEGPDASALLPKVRWGFLGDSGAAEVTLDPRYADVNPVLGVAILVIHIRPWTDPGIYRLTIRGEGGSAADSKEIVLEVLSSASDPIHLIGMTSNVQVRYQEDTRQIAQEEVTTPRDGFVDIGLGYQGKARIGPRSRVILGPKAGNRNAGADLVLLEGKMHVRWKAALPAPSPPSTGGIPPSEIKGGGTPIGGIGIHFAGVTAVFAGTEILIEVARDGTGSLTVLEGVVEMWRAEEPEKLVTVKGGERLVRRPDEPLREPVQIDLQETSPVLPLDTPLSDRNIKAAGWWGEPVLSAESSYRWRTPSRCCQFVP